MSDQISTLPLVIWQPSRRERLAKQIFIKSRQFGLRDYQRRMLAAMQPEATEKPRLRVFVGRRTRFVPDDYAEVVKKLPRHPPIL